jgi:hypothetical protein
MDFLIVESIDHFKGIGVEEVSLGNAPLANADEKDPRATTSVFELMKMGKPIGPVGDLILRFRDGELVTADTGDQGGGQN